MSGETERPTSQIIPERMALSPQPYRDDSQCDVITRDPSFVPCVRFNLLLHLQTMYSHMVIAVSIRAVRFILT